MPFLLNVDSAEKPSLFVAAATRMTAASFFSVGDWIYSS
jgi:hypothetical protein